MTDLDKLAALAEAATPGPYHRGADSDEFDWFVARTSQRMEDGVWARQPVNSGAAAELIAACDPATIRDLVAAARPVTVERMALALHKGDCIPNGLGLHEAGAPDAYCTLIAPAVCDVLHPETTETGS